jgi:hypothetical protein
VTRSVRLAIEEADAWFEYLASTKDQPEQRYREVERGRGPEPAARSGCKAASTTRRAKVKRR